MNYDRIWSKALAPGEKVEYSFSIGPSYIKFMLIMWGIISLLLLFAWSIGIFTFLFALFYFAFYLRVANAYAFTNKRVLIHRGWLSTHLTSIDYNKITDISVIEKFFDRVLTKSGHLVINTAGTTLHEITLKHIEAPYEVKKRLDHIRSGSSVKDGPLPS